MIGGMYGGLVLGVFLLFGFAYIIWVLAAKETGGIKLTGQIIAAVIAVIALLVLVYGSLYGGRMRGMGMMGGKGCEMMDSGKMNKMMPSSEKHQMMKEKMMDHMRK